MTLIEYARLVKLCRDAQRTYFADRRAGRDATAALGASKALERQLDAATLDILNGSTMTLFGGVE